MLEERVRLRRSQVPPVSKLAPRFRSLNSYWRAFFIGLCVMALVGVTVVALVPSFAGLFLLTLYCIPANSVLPIPHEPGVLYFAQFYDPLWIAIAGTVASVIVSFADYAIVGAALRSPRFKGAQSSRLFQWSVRWMKRWPFIIVVLFSFTPLPMSVIRVLAPASKYPIHRYALAQIVGRMPRFYALAWLGQTVKFPSWILGAMFVVLLFVFWLTGRSGESAEEADDESGDEADDEAEDDAAAQVEIDPTKPTPA